MGWKYNISQLKLTYLKANAPSIRESGRYDHNVFRFVLSGCDISQELVEYGGNRGRMRKMIGKFGNDPSEVR
jgi:hypothetical protein